MSTKKENNSGLIIQSIIVGIIMLVFTLFAFVIPQECDIDKQYLWCRVHPLSFLDIIGMILFYAGGAMAAGVPKWLGFELGSPTGSSSLNLYCFGGMVLGSILMWA